MRRVMRFREGVREVRKKGEGIDEVNEIRRRS